MTDGPAVAATGTLRTITRELVQTVRKNVTIDWAVRENVRADLRVLVKRILRKYGYPPDKQEAATRTLLEQGGGAVEKVGRVSALVTRRRAGSIARSTAVARMIAPMSLRSGRSWARLRRPEAFAGTPGCAVACGAYGSAAGPIASETAKSCTHPRCFRLATSASIPAPSD